ncbi:outer membrane beta-barrel protein [Microbulbifer pacificus]|uniref:Outer membrane beta-barrel protein n=1 Tax=Microbulbifer pacificus TaxID=407164 RepID=A0AAU0N4E4_9GAMM|nr:outer membrane beta-barrel protein [Microbulbifer pacificus]WOX06916.1 outer membrane beta-barrel protein [Microbulbifer pacificus]
MVRPSLLLVVPAALLANSASADFYSHRYGGAAALNGTLSGFCTEGQGFVNQLNVEEQVASTSSCEEESSGWKLYGGWQWSPYFAVEADFRQATEGDLKFEVTNPQLPFLRVRDRVTTRMGNAFVVGHLPIGRNGFSLFGKLGGGFWLSQFTRYENGEVIFQVPMEDGSTEEIAIPVSGKFGDNASGFHWGYGAGVSYSHSNSWTLRAEWELFPDIGSEDFLGQYDTQTTSVGWSMHF